ncbi:hypothetical protein J1C67_06660 [Clostridium gasigenes]|uniref:hypothetical protein n=1 Tax=Clostridium gasigenes TaxID=94869 RepID=UPI0014385FCF|nr:hypothetical protein [Clostridium gasigenes]NKF08310.1 hypothetical protein [Clostridium gasigenes]QSW20813.1 hypothetical protein J1C67_06660 [Clostridium gasigenes]
MDQIELSPLEDLPDLKPRKVNYNINKSNEILQFDGDNNELKIRMTMGFGNGNSGVEGITKYLWKNICIYLR